MLLLALGDAIPTPESTEGKILTILAAVAMFLTGLWNRRGTKMVENKTDDQTAMFAGLFKDMRDQMDGIKEAQSITDSLTTEELADHAGQLMSLAAAQGQIQATQEHQGRVLNDHGAQIVTLADGLARVQTVVNQRATDRALAGGLVSALTPTPPVGPVFPNGEGE